MDYKKQGRDFLKETGTTMSAEYLGQRKHFPDDKKPRDVYQITLQNERGFYSFAFGDSIKNTEDARNRAIRHKPDAYSVLACMQSYEPSQSVDEFASEFGYTKPSEAIRVHKAVLEEWEGVQRLFTVEQIEKLREIQ